MPELDQLVVQALETQGTITAPDLVAMLGAYAEGDVRRAVWRLLDGGRVQLDWGAQLFLT